LPPANRFRVAKSYSLIPQGSAVARNPGLKVANAFGVFGWFAEVTAEHHVMTPPGAPVETALDFLLLLLQVIIEPGEHALLKINAVRILLNAVAFARIDYQFSFDADVFQGRVEFLGLTNRNARVQLAVQ